MHTLMKSPRLSQSIVIQLIEDARSLRNQYSQRALNSPAWDSSSSSSANSLPLPLQSTAEKPRKKRTTVPWVQHSSVRPQPSRDMLAGGSEPESSSPPASPLPSVTEDLASVTRQWQQQLVHAERAVRNHEERERSVSKKASACVRKLADHLAEYPDETLASLLADLKDLATAAAGSIIAIATPPQLDDSAASQTGAPSAGASLDVLKSNVVTTQPEPGPNPTITPVLPSSSPRALRKEASVSAFPSSAAEVTKPVAPPAIFRTAQWGSSPEIRALPTPVSTTPATVISTHTPIYHQPSHAVAYPPQRATPTRMGSSEEIRQPQSSESARRHDPLGAGGVRGIHGNTNVVVRNGEPVTHPPPI
ncbi:hypothetical protein HKX48_009027 [Thoreauomyces humboldtii]|nr:hypothetical protein HKX48_009027 [Thoreauomyces humboldtii]